MRDASIWFPFYVQDYLGDTMHLSTLEHGAYLLLILAYWQRGPISDDAKTLANITNLSLSDWQATRSTVASFFQIRSGRWHHKRIDIEIEKAKSAKRAKSQGAAMTNKRRWSDSHSVSLSDTPSPSPSPLIPIKTADASRPMFVKPSIDELKLYCAKIGLPEFKAQQFLDFYESNGWKVGKNPMRSWEAAVRTWKGKWEAEGKRLSQKVDTVFQIKSVIEAKEKVAKAIFDKHASEGPLSTDWNDLKKRDEWRKLKQESKQLNEQLARMG